MATRKAPARRRTLPTSTRAPVSGRTRKGVPNKAKAAFRDALRAYATRKHVDPWHFMVDCIADDTTSVRLTADGGTITVPTVSLAHKIECAKELANYIEPKLRSVVVSGDAANPVSVLHAMPQDQFDTLLQRRLAEAGYTPAMLPEGAPHAEPQ